MRERSIEEVPWTLQQTFMGVLFTLIPWLIFSFAITLLNAKAPTTPTKLTFQQDLVSAIFSFIFTVIGEGVFLIAPAYFARKTTLAPGEHWRSWLAALGFRRFNVWQAVQWLIALFVAILVINYAYSALISALHLHIQVNSDTLLQTGKTAPLTLYATLLGAVIVAPFCEEVFFRSFTFMGLQRGMPLWIAIVFSALLFAVAHGDPGSFPVLACIGLVLAILRWRTQSIWPGMILHMLNNGASALLIILALHGIQSPV